MKINLFQSSNIGTLSLWSHENASLQCWLKPGVGAGEEKAAAQTKAVVSSAAEGRCLDTAVEMSASNNPIRLLVLIDC